MKGLIEVPEFLLEMSKQMREQDSRLTAHPIWQVRCKRYASTQEGINEAGYEIIEEVVSTHMTEADAIAFIARKGHDYPTLYTYVESAYWAPQLRHVALFHQ